MYNIKIGNEEDSKYLENNQRACGWCEHEVYKYGKSLLNPKCDNVVLCALPALDGLESR